MGMNCTGTVLSIPWAVATDDASNSLREKCSVNFIVLSFYYTQILKRVQNDDWVGLETEGHPELVSGSG